MRRILKLLLLVFVVSLQVQARAVDSCAYRFEEWKYAHIKTGEPNDLISLEKELMLVTRDSIRVVYVFKNTTAEYVDVPCSFPFNAVLPLKHPNLDSVVVTNDSVFLSGDGTCRQNHKLWSIALNKRVTPIDDIEYQLGFKRSALAAVRKKMRKYTLDEYETRVQELTDDSYLQGCSILQNGNHVPIENVGVETLVSDKDLSLTVFFHCLLGFDPYETVKVEVAYPIASLWGSCVGYPIYNVNYDVSFGGMWKGGCIKSFVVCSDFPMERHCCASSNRGMGHCSVAGKHIYYRRNFRPQAKDCFVFKNSWQEERDKFQLKTAGTGAAMLKDYLKNDSLLIGSDLAFPKGNRSPLSFVKNIRSSTNQDVTPLFDGDLYTSYVAPANSWIEFELTKMVLGPFVSNGNVNSTFNETIFRSMQQEQQDPDSVLRIPVFQDTAWSNTSRIRTMTLYRKQNAMSQVMMLDDKYGLLPIEVLNDDTRNDDNLWEYVNAVQRPLLLLPGRYRLSFGAVYKGCKWKTVGVSEIWFDDPFSNELLAMVEEDKNDSVQILQGYNRLIGKNWVRNCGVVPYTSLRSTNTKLYKECLNKYAEKDVKLGKELKRFRLAIAEEDKLLFRIFLISAGIIFLLLGVLFICIRRKK